MGLLLQLADRRSGDLIRKGVRMEVNHRYSLFLFGCRIQFISRLLHCQETEQNMYNQPIDIPCRKW